MHCILTSPVGLNAILLADLWILHHRRMLRYGVSGAVIKISYCQISGTRSILGSLPTSRMHLPHRACSEEASTAQ